MTIAFFQAEITAMIVAGAEVSKEVAMEVAVLGKII